MKLSSKHVMVTGGTGFIGGRLAERLAGKYGTTIHILARDGEKAERAAGKGYKVSVGDMNDPEAVWDAVEGCDLVFHCAHSFSLGMTESLRINVGSTRLLLEASLKAGVKRFVYMSSVAVYGRRPPDGADESVKLRITGDPYADSKIAAEKEVLAFGMSHGLSVVILRPPVVYGPASGIWSVGIVRSLQAKHPIVIGKGDGTCNYNYIDNLVDASILAATVKGASGETFVITDGEACSWREFVGYYSRMLDIESPPRCPLVIAYVISCKFYPVYLALQKLHDTPGWEPARFLIRATRRVLTLLREASLRICAFTPKDVRYFTNKAAFEISKARDILGYEPKVDLREGMRRTEEWLRDEGYLHHDS